MKTDLLLFSSSFCFLNTLPPSQSSLSKFFVPCHNFKNELPLCFIKQAALLHSPDPPSLEGPKTGPTILANAAAAAAAAAKSGTTSTSSAFSKTTARGGGREQKKEEKAKKRRSRTLVVATCAGVWHRTLSLLLSFEGSRRDDFDFMLAVTPR